MIGRERKRFAPFRVIDASVLFYLQETIIMERKIVRKDELDLKTGVVNSLRFAFEVI